MTAHGGSTWRIRNHHTKTGVNWLMHLTHAKPLFCRGSTFQQILALLVDLKLRPSKQHPYPLSSFLKEMVQFLSNLSFQGFAGIRRSPDLRSKFLEMRTRIQRTSTIFREVIMSIVYSVTNTS